jgi:hypothetical protein
MRWKRHHDESPATERQSASLTEPGQLTPKQRVRAVVDAITDGTTARPDQLQGLPAEVVLVL